MYASLKDLTFYIGTADQNYHISIPPQGYLTQRDIDSATGSSKNCETAVQSWGAIRDMDLIMIGQSFMKNFYIEFDYDNKEILLAGNAKNAWSVDLASSNGVDWSDSSDADESLPAIDVVMIVLASILFLTFGIFVCIKCKSKGNDSA